MRVICNGVYFNNRWEMREIYEQVNVSLDYKDTNTIGDIRLPYTVAYYIMICR